MSRAKIYGFLACIISIVIGLLFFYYAFFCVLNSSVKEIENLNNYSYYSISVPIVLVTLSILGLGFWIGWTILSIKVVPPMPELGEKKDYARIKAFFLCLFTLLLAILFLYGVYIKSYWSLAIPAATVTLVILGMVFWVGTAIILTRSTLPDNKQ
ncbi:MAG: hypothetical protein SVZ03_02850 [Spirochaetota bacterium]|nr:hypothetical protein [Spirochaetota bacterium]